MNPLYILFPKAPSINTRFPSRVHTKSIDTILASFLTQTIGNFEALIEFLFLSTFLFYHRLL